MKTQKEAVLELFSQSIAVDVNATGLRSLSIFGLLFLGTGTISVFFHRLETTPVSEES